MSKFYEVYNLIMEELQQELVKEATFGRSDFSKHTYVNDVINDILNNKKIKLNKNGTEEFEFSNLSNEDELELKEFLNLNDADKNIEKLNEILKRISNGKIVWNKIYKGKYSGVNRKNSTNNASLTELIPCILFNFNELYNYEINEEFINKIIDYISNSKMDESFLGNDKEVALKTFKEVDLNDKLTISKINSGKQCYELMKNILESRDISCERIYWCYRTKPPKVSSSNPSDVIILGKDKKNEEKYLGFSFKSGKFESEKGKGATKEPKLNSYVITVLKMYDENILINFYKEFNNKMKLIFPDFNLSNDKNLDDWKKYKQNNSIKLSKIDLNDIRFRTAQSMVIEFFINLFNNDKEHFKNFFINKCLGVMNMEEKTDENNNFFENGFYVLKGDERIQENAKAKIITPDVKKYSKMSLDEIKIVKSDKSVQSFYVYFGDDNYMFSVRTSSGESCKELPNLKFVCQ